MGRDDYTVAIFDAVWLVFRNHLLQAAVLKIATQPLQPLPKLCTWQPLKYCKIARDCTIKQRLRVVFERLE